MFLSGLFAALVGFGSLVGLLLAAVLGISVGTAV